jgi:sulfane dehydrogenase subunit SoxC
MRLLLPGWEGNANIKWLHVIKTTDKPYQTRQETACYTDLVCQDGACHARQFTFVMDAKSFITAPSAQWPLPRGFVEVRGLAWSGRGKIIQVEGLPPWPGNRVCRRAGVSGQVYELPRTDGH